MNGTQRKVLLAAAATVALMIIFPPYEVKVSNGLTLMAGYGFLFDLPEYVYQLFNGEIKSVPASVNVKTLLVQIFGAVVVGGLAFLACNKSSSN